MRGEDGIRRIKIGGGSDASLRGCLLSGRRSEDFRMTSFADCVLACGLAAALTATALGQGGVGQKVPPATAPPKTAADESSNSQNGLVIEPQELPPTYPRGPYQVVFHARGNYVPVLHWKLEKGALPPGIRLDDNGALHGEAQRAGEFQFVVAVRDGGQPQQAVQKE